MEPVTAFLGLGANVGDRRRNIGHALERLAVVPGVEVLATSELIETAPVGGPPQESYLNGATKLATTLPAVALLHVCKQIERAAGRDLLAPRNSPRPLDLDILLYGDAIIDTRDLRVPHPRMLERDFVLRPLSQLTSIDDLPRIDRPVVIREPEPFAALNTTWLRGDCTTGLVPTMGALHEGHLSLMRCARAECDRVAATVFVNPAQFGKGEDFESYPRDFDTDLSAMAAVGVDAVFAPAVSGVYPDGFGSSVGAGVEAQTMEGASRPTHFDGVTTIVAKLFNLARPARAYFGQKDAQQAAVIRRMVMDLDYPLHVRICPIVREPDGLAMSSRNAYLDAEDRAAAPVLVRGLRAARELYRQGERDHGRLLAAARRMIEAEPRVRLDYLELRAEGSLAALPPGSVAGGRLLVAGYFGEAAGGEVRLLDNMMLGDDPTEILEGCV